MNAIIVQYLNIMASQDNILVTTPIIGTDEPNKNYFLLGEWCKDLNAPYLEQNHNINTMKHHWTSSSKLFDDAIYLEKLYEKLLKIFVKKLNIYHKVNFSLPQWRIILGPWLSVYLSSMFDKWETLRVFFKKSQIDLSTYDFEYSNDILINYGTIDYITKVTDNDLWHHKNFMRIIDFQFKNKLLIKKIKQIKNFKEKEKKKEINLIEIFKLILHKFIGFIDKPISFLALKFNTVIFESSYFSKFNLIKLFFRLSIIPAFYQNIFDEKKFKENKTINKNDREDFFSNTIDLVDDFEKYLFHALKEDFPISYFERFKEIDSKNSLINIIKKKMIITMTSHIGNERFKIWLSRMIVKGSKIYVAEHGGFLKFKINGFFEHELKICEKFLIWQKSEHKKEIQISPVQLLKVKKLKRNKPQTLLIVNCETVKYPTKIQSWPYAEQYKDDFYDVCNFVKKLKPEVYKNVIYRSNNFGYNTCLQFKKNFKDLKTHDSNKSKIYEDFKNSKIIVCNYPDTPLTEALVANIPTIVIFSKKLYQVSDQALVILNKLKENNIFFEDSLEASKHINDIWENPDKWWNSSSTQKTLKLLSDYAFNLRNDWIVEWSNFINKEKYLLNDKT